MYENTRPYDDAEVPALERPAHRFRRRVDEVQPERLDQVLQRPAAHDAVVGDDPQRGEHHQET